MSRKLVSVQTISRIEPIPGADRIVLAHVLGWKVIISKDMHLSVGDKVAYFETDSLLLLHIHGHTLHKHTRKPRTLAHLIHRTALLQQQPRELTVIHATPQYDRSHQ